MIVFAGIMPHPPISIPEVGKGEEKKVFKTSQAMLRLARDLYEAEPDTIIVISPHMTHYPQLFNICGMSRLYGNFNNFGARDWEWRGKNNTLLAADIADESESEGLPAILFDSGEAEYELDHGTLVPLYFLSKEEDYHPKILPISYSIASRSEHYAFGQIISEVVEKRTTERVAIIASGDLSHRLSHGKSSDLSNGAKFDKTFLDYIKSGDEYSIVNIDDNLLDEAGECAYRSTLVLLGTISNREYKPEVYSYEGPLGVGYAVVNMNIS